MAWSKNVLWPAEPFWLGLSLDHQLFCREGEQCAHLTLMFLRMCSADSTRNNRLNVNPSFQSIVSYSKWSHSFLALFLKIILNPYTAVVMVQLWVEQNSHCLSARLLLLNLQIRNPYFIIKRWCIWDTLYQFNLKKGLFNQHSSIEAEVLQVRFCPKACPLLARIPA